jgi:hypothetical protein
MKRPPYLVLYVMELCQLLSWGLKRIDIGANWRRCLENDLCGYNNGSAHLYADEWHSERSGDRVE